MSTRDSHSLCPPQIVKILTLLAISLGLAVAFVPANNKFVRATPKCATNTASALTTVNFAALDDELDNVNIPEDPELRAARNCGFCIG